jgi:anti-sigma-K factor RskA
MRFDDPGLRDILAGEYALGTLRGRARKRFRRLLGSDANLRQLVTAWQERFAPLTEETRSVPPPARVFLAIKARLEAEPVPVVSKRWQRLGFWQALSAGVAAVALSLAVLLGVLQLRSGTVPAGPSYIAVLQDEAARPALIVTSYNKPSWHLVIEPKQIHGVAPGQTLQVWAIARDGGATRPLVALAVERTQRINLDEAAWKLVKGAEFLIVTLEHAGDVPQAPSGPTLYRGYCVNLKGIGAS